jgi:catalase (peroxidase I)
MLETAVPDFPQPVEEDGAGQRVTGFAFVQAGVNAPAQIEAQLLETFVGDTFGKTHGAADPGTYVGREPEATSIEEQGLGWKNSFGTGKGVHTITSGLEGAWTTHPTRWDNGYFDALFGYEWQLTRSPAGAHQWTPTDPAAAHTAPDAHDPSRRHAPMMSTAEMALKVDPIYEPIARRFHQHPELLADAFARAWFKLTHRDMGPRSRYLGPQVPSELLLWQDPMPAVEHALVDDGDVAALKSELLHLVLGSNCQLRALAEVCASADAQLTFVRDFVQAWNKVMNLDRFDLART